MDVALDGVTESNITQLPATSGYHHRVLGATIIGNQDGDSCHRLWLNKAANLLMYDSFDEGQTWTVTDMGIYDTNNYKIVGTFYTSKTTSGATGCVGPGDEINYTISYSYPGDMNCPDINDVNIIDYLPPEVDFNSASTGGVYNPSSRTVTWNIGTLHPGDLGSVWLKVNVRPCVKPCSTITNCCKIKSGDDVRSIACEDTPVCCPTLTKVDDVNDCVSLGLDDYITYNICYAANGYGDTNVVIVDYLPDEVDYNSLDPNASDPCGFYNPGPPRTVTWYIGTLKPNESNCVTLKVKVKRAEPCGTITNRCELMGDCIHPIYAYASTPVYANYLVVDNFESYNNYSNKIYNTWKAVGGAAKGRLHLTSIMPR